MTDLRMVAMTAEQAAEVERYIKMLMRGNRNERAARMMELAAAYKFASPLEPVLPDNVVEFGGWSRKVGA